MTAAAAVGPALADTARAADAAAVRLSAGGRLAYAGAGTSGRLALQDGVELVPTFGWDPSRTLYLLAGGDGALSRAIEGAEDDEEAATVAVRDAALGPNDVLVALAASGRTPFTRAAARAARAAGTLVVAVANAAGAPLLAEADHPVVLATGPEAIAGSTRMKAGTAQRIWLTLFSTTVMVRLGRVHGGAMVDLVATNAKLRLRALRLVATIAGVGSSHAEAALGLGTLSGRDGCDAATRRRRRRRRRGNGGDDGSSRRVNATRHLRRRRRQRRRCQGQLVAAAAAAAARRLRASLAVARCVASAAAHSPNERVGARARAAATWTRRGVAYTIHKRESVATRHGRCCLRRADANASSRAARRPSR